MKKIIFASVLCGFCVGAIYSPSFAQMDLKKGEPVEITADDTLEWHRNELYFKATKNVKAVQGDTVLHAQTLTALYREGKDSGIDIYRIEADASVKIVTGKTSAYGDHAIYNMDKGYAEMTGKKLRMLSEDQNVTARDKFEYWVNDGRLEAHGDVVAIQQGDKIESDKMIAIFTQDKSGKRVLKTMEAIGNVVITTPTEVLTGGRAIYRAVDDIAEINGHVTVSRGPNKLQGTRAQVNLKTNISKLFGGASQETNDGTGRVRGVFYPGSQE